MATYKHIAKLIVKHRNNALNEREKEELETWRNLSNENQLLFNRLNDSGYDSEKPDELYSVDINEEWGRIRHMFPDKKKRRFVTVMKYMALVAGLFLGGMAVFAIWKRNKGTAQPIVENAVSAGMHTDSAPDKHRIALTLADSSIIYLDSSWNGHITLQYQSVLYKQGNVLRYEWSTGDAHPGPEYNTVTTPRTRTFAVELPDGSKAWLNAASSITYPTAFTGKERLVQITGEVYFEVNPNPATLDEAESKMPFIVCVKYPSGKGNGARVEVMGTHFNVNAYCDEPAIQTTLLEGKVKVVNRESAPDGYRNGKPRYGGAGCETAIGKPGEESAILTHGQQAHVTCEGKLDVIKYANIQEVMAWQKELFIFNDADIRQIMQQIARQYDYNIVFKEPVNGHYSLSTSRQEAVSEILEKLELAGGIHFEIDDKKIIVYK